MQGCQWGVCSMNKFREFLGLKKFSDFEEWCSDKEVAKAAQQLYEHIDNLELYPGDEQAGRTLQSMPRILANVQQERYYERGDVKRSTQV